MGSNGISFWKSTFGRVFVYQSRWRHHKSYLKTIVCIWQVKNSVYSHLVPMYIKMTASSSIHFTNKGIRLTQLRLKFTRKGQIMHIETLQVTLISADRFILNVQICQFKILNFYVRGQKSIWAITYYMAHMILILS